MYSSPHAAVAHQVQSSCTEKQEAIRMVLRTFNQSISYNILTTAGRVPLMTFLKPYSCQNFAWGLVMYLAPRVNMRMNSVMHAGKADFRLLGCESKYTTTLNVKSREHYRHFTIRNINMTAFNLPGNLATCEAFLCESFIPWLKLLNRAVDHANPINTNV